MKLIIQNSRVVGTATDDYNGPDEFVSAPQSFDSLRMAEYVSVANVVSIPALTKEQLIAQIDAEADAITRAVQGDRALEYLRAEQEATVYKASGYTGQAPSSVTSWSGPKKKSDKWATDDILATAAGWRQAQESIRAARLACKEDAKVAPDLAPVAAQWAGFVAAIKTALGVA
jgi:hypothetical protein